MPQVHSAVWPIHHGEVSNPPTYFKSRIFLETQCVITRCKKHNICMLHACGVKGQGLVYQCAVYFFFKNFTWWQHQIHKMSDTAVWLATQPYNAWRWSCRGGRDQGCPAAKATTRPLKQSRRCMVHITWQHHYKMNLHLYSPLKILSTGVIYLSMGLTGLNVMQPFLPLTWFRIL